MVILKIKAETHRSKHSVINFNFKAPTPTPCFWSTIFKWKYVQLTLHLKKVRKSGGGWGGVAMQSLDEL